MLPIPIRTDRRQERTPWVNYALILANVLVFVVLQRTQSDTPEVRPYLLHPDYPKVLTFFTSMFMHANWAHLLGNMLFLWVFGNAVNDSFGHLGYLAFYLAGGLAAGIAFIGVSGAAPVLGASGAISAVTGAFLVLFPRVRVTVLLIFFYIIPFEITSLVFLALQFVWNLVLTLQAPGGGGGVAYAAHSGGYVFGIGIAGGLLAAGLLPRDVYDLLSLVRTWRRRQSYRRMVAGGYAPFSGPTRLRRPGGQWVEPEAESDQAPEPGSREAGLRGRISELHRRGDFALAARGYLELVQLSSRAVLPQAQQLDVANYLMSAEQYAAAADAYERFLAHYGNYQYVGDIKLMLGLIYGRYLRQDDRAEMYLSQALSGLLDEGKLELARTELAKVRQRRGS
ncbi:MAG: rhomboid family intramembrane serine protease [Planctomycetota bacterium]|jgi:membrane associated rhomboid family serine protease